MIGLYWISSSTSLRNTTAPSVTPRLLPTSNAPMLTWLGMPPLCTMSLARCERPSSRLLPPVSKKRLTAAGLAAVLVGAKASVIRLITKCPRATSLGPRLLSSIHSWSSLRHAR
ncbi:hypothetical protein D3C72_1505550 [compost metagenome]